MASTLKPRTSTIVKYMIPGHLRSSNPNLVKFLEYYYQYLEATGNPLDILQNMLEFRDIDSTSPVFAETIIKKLLQLIPPTSVVDKPLLAKHIREFFVARGSLPSFEFIMNALFGEKVRQEWMSAHVLRASSNEYSRNARVAIRTDDNLSDCVGSYLVQTSPQYASGLIEEAESFELTTGTVWDIKLNDKTVNGVFVPGGDVKALGSTIDRTFTEITDYYPVVALINDKLTIRLTKDMDFAGLVILQPDLPKARAVVTGVDSYFNDTTYKYVVLDIEQVDGLLDYNLVLEQGGDIDQENGDQLWQDQKNFNANEEVYFVASFSEGFTFTKVDYAYGIVDPIIGNIMVTEPGAMYTLGQNITFTGGTGTGAAAYIGEVFPGKVDNILIPQKGFGYSVGDPVVFDNTGTEGYGIAAQVSSIDGVEGVAHGIYELQDIILHNAGSGYAVGDELEVIGGTRLLTSNPARITVSSVNSTWALQSIAVLNGGSGYTYTKVALINNVGDPVGGFAAQATLTAGKIISVALTTIPAITSASYQVLVNGAGAILNATCSGGAITAVSIANAGVNYVDPVIDVFGDGHSAIILPTIDSSGRIVGATISKGGVGYTAATLVARERFGSGAVLQPIIANQTLGTGSITGYTIASRGDYLTLPDSTYSQLFKNNNAAAFRLTQEDGSVLWQENSDSFMVGGSLGVSAVASLKFRVKSVELDHSGYAYREVLVKTTSGHGDGAVLAPQIFNGVIRAPIAVDTAGAGYTWAKVIVAGHGVGANLVATIGGGTITGISVVDGGVGYDNALDTLSGGSSVLKILGDGTGATAHIPSGSIKDGVIKNVQVVEKGLWYSKDATVSMTSSAGGSLPGSFTLSVDDVGSITKVNIVDGGYGYITDLNWHLNQENGDQILIEGGELLFDSLLDRMIINTGELATFAGTTTGTGKLLTVSIENAGSGYTDPSEVTPLTLTVNGIGYGALLKPVISNGNIIAVNILKSGLGYDGSTTISVTGGGSGTGAALTPVITNGRLTSVIITSAGVNYKYGTKAYVLGDGFGAQVNLSVNTGLTSVVITQITLLLEQGGELEQEDGFRIIAGQGSGTGYPDNSTITLTDPTGTGAILRPTFSGGALVDIEIVQEGSGYTDPKITVNGNIHSDGASALAYVDRYIKSATVSAPGQDYVSGYILLVADGIDGLLTPHFEAAGSISSLSLLTTGSSYTGTPGISVTDSSLYGAVTGIQITNPGSSSYKKVPVAYLDNKFNLVGDIVATGANLACVSSTIGGVKTNVFTDFGLDYREVPLVTYPLVAIVSENFPFITGEDVIVESYPYGSATDAEIYLLLENGDNIRTDGDGIIGTDNANLQYVTQIVVREGPSGKVGGFDYDRNSLYIANATDQYRLVDETGKVLIQESGLNLVNEFSNAIELGDVLVGTSSGSKAKILYIARASGVAEQVGNAFMGYQALNDASKLNHPLIKLHNGERIQDFAYVLTTGLSLNEYASFIKETVHPAGFKMFGDVEIGTKVSLPLLEPVWPPNAAADFGDGLVLQIFLPTGFPHDMTPINGSLEYTADEEEIQLRALVQDLKTLKEDPSMLSWPDEMNVVKYFFELEQGGGSVTSEAGEYLTTDWHNMAIFANETTVFPVIPPETLALTSFYKSASFIDAWKNFFTHDTPILVFETWTFNNAILGELSYFAVQRVNGYEGTVDVQDNLLTEDGVDFIQTETPEYLLQNQFVY